MTHSAENETSLVTMNELSSASRARPPRGKNNGLAGTRTLDQPRELSGVSLVALRGGLEQFLDGLDVAGREGPRAIRAAVEGAAHLVGQRFGEGEGEYHTVIGPAVQEGMQIVVDGLAEFLDREALPGLGILHDPKLEDVDGWALQVHKDWYNSVSRSMSTPGGS